MKLWLLRPAEDLVQPDEYWGFWNTESQRENPWNPWCDKAFGFVVRAETETEARAMVVEKKQDGDETRDWLNEWEPEKQRTDRRNPWLDPDLSSCQELTADGLAEIIIRDFAAA